jgi:hypothetical protein
VSEPGSEGVEDFPGFEVSSIRPAPDAEEHAAIVDALADYLARDQGEPVGSRAGSGGPATRPAWALAGRLAARRGGILDARTWLGSGVWPASARLPWAGRPHQGRAGRGDSA